MPGTNPQNEEIREELPWFWVESPSIFFQHSFSYAGNVYSQPYPVDAVRKVRMGELYHVVSLVNGMKCSEQRQQEFFEDSGRVFAGRKSVTEKNTESSECSSEFFPSSSVESFHHLKLFFQVQLSRVEKSRIDTKMKFSFSRIFGMESHVQCEMWKQKNLHYLSSGLKDATLTLSICWAWRIQDRKKKNRK